LLSYKFIEGIALADVAFEASGRKIEDLFKSCGEALTSVMVNDPKKIKPKFSRRIRITAQSPEYLLFGFLNKIIFYKDAQRLLFGKFEISIKGNGKWELDCTAYGDRISEKYDLDTDVKGVSMHMFKLSNTGRGFVATVVLDV